MSSPDLVTPSPELRTWARGSVPSSVCSVAYEVHYIPSLRWLSKSLQFSPPVEQKRPASAVDIFGIHLGMYLGSGQLRSLCWCAVSQYMIEAKQV